jgi:hypothetical protein
MAGLLREIEPATPSYSDILCDQINWPVCALTEYKLPAESGKRTASPKTVGVAETSPPLVKTHFTASECTFRGPINRSAGRLRELAASWPAMGHWSWIRSSGDPEANEHIVSPSRTRKLLYTVVPSLDVSDSNNMKQISGAGANRDDIVSATAGNGAPGSHESSISWVRRGRTRQSARVRQARHGRSTRSAASSASLRSVLRGVPICARMVRPRAKSVT